MPFGDFPEDGVVRDLADLYHIGNDGSWRQLYPLQGKPLTKNTRTTPASISSQYASEVAARGERWAEAGRALATAPEWIRATYPKVVDKYRQAIGDSWLREYIDILALPDAGILAPPTTG